MPWRGFLLVSLLVIYAVRDACIAVRYGRLGVVQLNAPLPPQTISTPLLSTYLHTCSSVSCSPYLTGYRSTLSDAAIGPNQLALPDTLKTLPLHILGLLKHPAFLENPREVILVPAHVRVQALWGLLSGTVEQIVQEVLPRLVNVFAVMDELMGGTGSISGMKEDWDVGLSISRPTSLTLSNPINPHSTPSRTMTPHTTPPQAPQTAPAVPPLSSPMPPPLPMHTSASSTATTTPMQSPATSFYCSPVLPSPHMRISRLLRQYALPCSAEVLQPDQMHLLDDGIYLWLLVGRQVNHDVVEDIFR